MTLLPSKTKTVGWQAPDFTLTATDGESYTLKDFVFKKGLCVVFTCNHCPYAKASWGPLIELDYAYPSIAFVAINSNDSTTYPEDSFAKMKTFHTMYGLPFPYLHDADQSVAKAYDAQCTPDIYLFANNEGVFELFYHGRINDNRQDPSAVKEKNLEDHCKKLLANEKPADVWPPSTGCSIKWKN